MAKEFQISSDELSKEGYSNLAVKAMDNKLDASRLDTEAAREEAAKLAKALNAKTSKIHGVTAADLSVLLKEAEQTSQSDSDEEEESGSETGDIPDSVKKAADAARAQINKTFGAVGSPEYTENMSLARQLLVQHLPGLDVSGLADVDDVLYQPRERINQLIDALENASGDDSLTINLPGKYADMAMINEVLGFLGFGKIIGFKTVEEKREYIKAMLEGMTRYLSRRPAGHANLVGNGADVWWLGLVALGGYLGCYQLPKLLLQKSFSSVIQILSFGKIKPTFGTPLYTPEKAKKVGGIAKKVWGMRPGAKPVESSSATPGTTPAEHTRELNLANNKLDAAASEAILRNIYNAERVAANLAPLADTAKLPTEWTPDGLSINNLNAYNLYHERIKQYLSLPDRPSDPKKLEEWKQEFGRIIHGERKPGTVWRPGWLGGTSASERASYTGNERARTDVAHKAMRSAVAEANVVEWTYGGLTVKLSGEMQPLTQELSVKEAEHTKKMKELQALIDEKTRLEGIKRQLNASTTTTDSVDLDIKELKDEKARLEGLKKQLEKRMQEEITIESNTVEIKRLEGEIAKLNDAATGKVAEAQGKVAAKNLEIAKHRGSFKDVMGQVDSDKFDADSHTAKLKGELRVLEGELAKHNRSLEKLEKTLSDLESAQRQNITSYREKYRSSPRLSTVTADKLKGVGTAGTHGDGVENKITANEQAQKTKMTEIVNEITANESAQQSKINELKQLWRDIKDIGVRMEATPKMAGKLNGLVASDASIKTSIGGKEIEIKSLKGLTQKIMQIGAEAFKVGTKG